VPHDVGRQKVSSRKIIEQHAEDLFISKGVENTTVNEIVKVAGIAKGTFYLYFKNKNELIDSIISAYTSDFLKTVLESYERELKIKTLSQEILKYFSKNPFYLVELRRNLTSAELYESTKRTIGAFMDFVMKYNNKLDEYVIHDWYSYTAIILGMILDVSFRTLITDNNKESGSVFLGDILKRFFSCTD